MTPLPWGQEADHENLGAFHLSWDHSVIREVFPQGPGSLFIVCNWLEMRQADASRPITGKGRQEFCDWLGPIMHLPRSALRKVFAYFALSFVPWGGMVSDAENLAWGPCSITSATRAWTRGLPAQPRASSVILLVRIPTSQHSED